MGSPRFYRSPIQGGMPRPPDRLVVRQFGVLDFHQDLVKRFLLWLEEWDEANACQSWQLTNLVSDCRDRFRDQETTLTKFGQKRMRAQVAKGSRLMRFGAGSHKDSAFDVGAHHQRPRLHLSVSRHWEPPGRRPIIKQFDWLMFCLPSFSPDDSRSQGPTT
jgi:hypothetical protein